MILLLIGVIVYESTATDGHIIDYIFKHNPKLTAVIHCAGIHGNNNDPLNGADNNIKPMVTILDTISRYKVKSLHIDISFT